MTSTLLLTILLMIGLFFFIRGSIKDRTEIVTLACQDNEDNILSYLRNYFLQRSYQVKAIDPDKNKVILEGFVSPSIFLASFLSFLAGCGLFCFTLVLSMLFKTEYIYFVGLVIFAPLAGWFYWRGASRVEEVAFRLDAKPENSKDTIITIQAHRDELIELQSSFPFSYTVQDD
ncbi:cofactor assembly of complex C subunit B [Cyanobacterium aponinum FACHB-4101]|uniref:cofactor assembly of complex C subunit B n=1 Tax=Cyanobacterium aponinum TaxID=379064 RepID=UPI001681A05D|nr:cofactor assembly of complex C subunit B [Cyanobacterium aponinum]MBD2394229.1 cofactor assembly of complex C subunit B [Cyanobacterium aponinum FACHB-4101]